MPKLKILVVSHHYWPEPFRMNQVVEDLIAAGAKVTVLTGHPCYPVGREYPGYESIWPRIERHPAGYDICRIPVVKRTSGSARRLAFNYLSFVVSGVLVAPWLLRKRRFDVQFVYMTSPAIQGYVAIWLKLLKRAPIVLWVQDIWPEALAATGYVKSRWAIEAMRKVVSAMYRRCDLLMGQSDSFVRTIRGAAGRTPVKHFPNPGEHPSPEVADAPRLPTDRFNIVFGGNIGRAQAMDTVLAAAELLRDDLAVHFWLFGSGSMCEFVERAIRERSLSNVSLGGQVPAATMAAVFRQASALLLPLVDDPTVSQTVPSKLQSYLGSGRPVIAAVNGEAARIALEAGAGRACPAEDSMALAAAVRELRSSSPEELDEMGAAGLRYFMQHYEPTKLAHELLHTLTKLASDEEFRASIQSRT